MLPDTNSIRFFNSCKSTYIISTFFSQFLESSNKISFFYKKETKKRICDTWCIKASPENHINSTVIHITGDDVDDDGKLKDDLLNSLKKADFNEFELNELGESAFYCSRWQGGKLECTSIYDDAAHLGKCCLSCNCVDTKDNTKGFWRTVICEDRVSIYPKPY